MTKYSKVRFVGFAIPTTPASIVGIGDVDGPGAVAGTFPAFADRSRDIAARLDVMQSAVDAAFKKIAQAPADDSVLNIFVAPEFFWHSDVGPYVYSSKDTDPADEILGALNERFPAEKYPNTVFIFGTAISTMVDDLNVILNDSSVAQRNNVVRAIGEGWLNTTGPMQDALFDMLVNFVKLGHSYPRLEVRNRAMIVGAEKFLGVNNDLDANFMTTEKYYASNEDFLLWDVTGKPVITEQIVAYPSLDLSGGDFKVDPKDPKAIFNVADGPTLGVEICLDHSDHRLRRSASISPWPSPEAGVNLHLVPSCGMQLHPASVAAIAGGLAFNTDGLYGLDGAEGGKVLTGEVGGVDCVHVSYIDGSNTTYGAHSQLTRVVDGPVEGDSALPGAKDATFSIPDVDVTIIDVPRTATTAEVFAGGAGAVHIYGLTNPLSI